MQQVVNSVYKPLFQSKSRYKILIGGRGAGRSTVASQLALANLISNKYSRTAIMRYILGDIRNSIYREITDRAEENGIKDHLSINDSTMTIRYGANSINAVGFKKSSGDQKSKLKSLANYNCVIIEEADEIPEADFMQLDDSLRTVKGDITIILLLNPPAKTHWIIKRWFDLLPSETKDFYIPKLKAGVKDTLVINTNYKDNIKNIAAPSIEQYENYKTTNPDHYWNMIAGLVPEVLKGKIFSGWEKIKEVPKEARLERYGLDFGYTNDPTAVIALYKWNNAIVIDEKIYKAGMLNSQIAAEVKDFPKSLIIADAAEPKSISEIQLHGVDIMGAEKGQGSLLQGIQAVKNRKIYVTESSSNVWNEYDNYSWKEDKDGTMINVPKPGYDHCFVGKTLITTKNGLIPIKQIKKGQLVLTSKGYKPVLKHWSNGIKQVNKYSLQFDTFKIELESTPDHKIKTGSTWTKISKLKSGQTITLTKNLMEKHINYTLERGIFPSTLQECTLLFGDILMELYQKVSKYITRMETPGITLLKTCNLYLDQNTKEYTENVELRKIKSGLQFFKKKALNQQSLGINQKMAKPGILNMEKNHGLTEHTKKKYVSFVERHTKLDMLDYQSIAIKTVKLRRLDVEKRSKKTVYDLTIKDSHEYFANGVLVHNCMDAIRYAVVDLFPIDEEEKKEQEKAKGQQLLDKLKALKSSGGWR